MSARSGSPARRRVDDAGFVLDTRRVGRRPGSLREVRRTVTTPERIGLDMIGIPAGSDIELELCLQAVSEGVLVTGTVSAPLVGECGRCLESFGDDIVLQLTELFAYPDSATERTTEENEVYRTVDEHIDLEPVIVDTAGLALALQPLCRPDCPGLCPQCGIRLAIAESDHHHEILDPRWTGPAAKFADLSPSDGLDDAHTDDAHAEARTTEEK